MSYLSQDRPDLKFASMRACCAMAKPSMRDMERVKRIGRYFAGSREQSADPWRAKCTAGSRVASWRRIQTLTGEATAPLNDRCQPESS